MRRAGYSLARMSGMLDLPSDEKGACPIAAWNCLWAEAF